MNSANVERVNEDSFTIQIRDRGGKFRSYMKSEIRDLRKYWGKSPMPAMGGVLNADEIADLVSFLAVQRGGR